MEEVDYNSISTPAKVIVCSALGAIAAGLLWGAVHIYNKGVDQSPRYSADYVQSRSPYHVSHKNSIPVKVSSEEVGLGGLEEDVLGKTK
jgi:hypothetical protein